ncbi:MAG: DNA translocase FtsK 4TM domain-containing protein [Holosporaceae bacterium]|jgi:S-DNA-T family DNA segregation ATPase FtsK/SpoIIIE|nr:DNA translocase FtsK 4TM domain-containing protein [Holosporaceae bacterium]
MSKNRIYTEAFLDFVSNLYLYFVEFFGVCVFFAALVTVVALVSYCPEDPSLNTAIDGVPSNVLSLAGSYYADVMIQLLGKVSYVFSAILLSFGYQMIKYHEVSFGRVVSCLVACISASVIFAIYGWRREEAGLVGYWIFTTISTLIDNYEHLLPLEYAPQICKFIFLLVFLITFSYALHFSWLNFFVLLKQIVKLGEKFGLEKLYGRLKKVKLAIVGNNRTKDDDSVEGDGLVVANYGHASRALSAGSGIATKFVMPLPSLLKEAKLSEEKLTEAEIKESSENLMEVLTDFGIKGEIIGASSGPVVTLYELKPAAGIKSSRVIGLSSDIARYMSAVSARVAVIPGRNALGIELPNTKRQTVFLREILESSVYKKSASVLPISLGKDISGEAVVADLAKMPHLLIAGTTGSGKSVGINAMILSLLYKLPPSECKFIMVDPKMLELSVYDDIPHLLTPVVTDPKKAVVALKWAVKEMESRYKAMSKLGVRNIEGYNSKLASMKSAGEEISRRVHTGFDPETGEPVYENQTMDLERLPYIVIIVDEMADLMLVAGKDIELAVQRLAQMARAAGIHLIMATQRPSVDVITGTIKANFPTRISFQVSSKIDSRTILGEQGAEQLLGQGDMLYMASGGRTIRIHCPFVSDSEVEKVATYLKEQDEPRYIETILDEEDEIHKDEDELYDSGDGDPMYKEAVTLILREGKVSTSFIQRHLKIGYNRAARIVDMMETAGIVSAANHVGKREILGR